MEKDICERLAELNAMAVNHPDIPVEMRKLISDLAHEAHGHIGGLRIAHDRHTKRIAELERERNLDELQRVR